MGGTHCARLAVEADEQQDLGHQDGEGQVGVDVVALVPDGADRAEGRGQRAGGRGEAMTGLWEAGPDATYHCRTLVGSRLPLEMARLWAGPTA